MKEMRYTRVSVINLFTHNQWSSNTRLTSQTNPVSQQSAPNEKFPKWVLVVLVVLLLTTTGLLAFRNYQPKPKITQVQPISPPTNPISTQTSEPTAGWKTYENEKHKFVINYPDDWKYEERTHRSSRDGKTKVNKILFSPIQVFDTDPGVFKITIYSPEKDLPLESFLNSYLCFPVGEGNNRCSSVFDDTTEFSFDAHAKRVVYHPIAHSGESIVIKRNGEFYEFEIDFEKPIHENKNVLPDERRELFRQILDSLEFID